jgi:hypothetical protein
MTTRIPLKACKVHHTVRGAHYPKPFTLPVRTVLSVERIYIRKGAERFDSITFRVKSSPWTECEKARFWVALDDANEMEVE